MAGSSQAETSAGVDIRQTQRTKALPALSSLPEEQLRLSQLPHLLPAGQRQPLRHQVLPVSQV